MSSGAECGGAVPSRERARHWAHARSPTPLTGLSGCLICPVRWEQSPWGATNEHRVPQTPCARLCLHLAVIWSVPSTDSWPCFLPSGSARVGDQGRSGACGISHAKGPGGTPLPWEVTPCPHGEADASRRLAGPHSPGWARCSRSELGAPCWLDPRLHLPVCGGSGGSQHQPPAVPACLEQRSGDHRAEYLLDGGQYQGEPGQVSYRAARKLGTQQCGGKRPAGRSACRGPQIPVYGPHRQHLQVGVGLETGSSQKQSGVPRVSPNPAGPPRSCLRKRSSGHKRSPSSPRAERQTGEKSARRPLPASRGRSQH